MEHRQNTGIVAEHLWNSGTLVEKRTTGATSGTREHQHSKGAIRITTNTEQRNIEQIT